jgi:hypothetical protein
MGLKWYEGFLLGLSLSFIARSDNWGVSVIGVAIAIIALDNIVIRIERKLK